jgi:hypothetical protein
MNRIIKFFSICLLFVPATAFSFSGNTSGHDLKNSIEFSPLSPLFKIYAVQYAREFRPKHEYMLGVAFANIDYGDGRSHAPGLIVGYRYFFVKGLHLEYQLWPAWNAYYEKEEQKYYKGFELWNEFRVGYVFEFKIASHNFSVIPQVLAGFGLLPGNKPDSFLKHIETEGLFVAPVLFFGYKF